MTLCSSLQMDKEGVLEWVGQLCEVQVLDQPR